MNPGLSAQPLTLKTELFAANGLQYSECYELRSLECGLLVLINNYFLVLTTKKCVLRNE